MPQLQSARQLGLEDKTLRTHLALGWLAARMGRLAPARRRLLSAWRTARRLRLAREEALAFEFLAETYLLGGSLPKARLAARCCRRMPRPVMRDTSRPMLLPNCMPRREQQNSHLICA